MPALLIQFAITYLLSRLTQPNGPRVKDLSVGFGDYGVVFPVLFGSIVRIVTIALAADDIKETVHKHKPATDFLFGIAGALLPSTKTYTYSITLAVGLADRTNDDPIEGLQKLYAGGKVIFHHSESAVVSETLDGDGRLVRRKYKGNKFCKSVTVYGGGFEQTADPILNAVIGPQPGYRGSAYAVIEDLQLKDFGNAPPVPIEALVQCKTDESLASVIESIGQAAGIDPVTEMSTTAGNDIAVRGYSVTNEAKCWDAIKPLLPAFAVDVSEISGQLRLYRRAQTMRATILTDDMGAYVYGDEPSGKFTFRRETDTALPQETSLTFVDPAREYQTNTASSKRSEGSAESNITAEIPLVMTADEGASAAALMHWDAHLGRSRVSFSLTDAWNGIEPGLAYALPVAGSYVPYRIRRKTRGANGITEIEAQSDEEVTYTASVTGTSGNPPPVNSTVAADTRIILVDGPLLSDSDDEYGFYLVMAATDLDWSGAEVQGSLDGVTYLDLILSSDSAVAGDVTGTLPAGPTTGLDDTLDTTTTLTVVLLHDQMTLASATDAELDGFANLAFVGKDGIGEYLQFKTATFISGSTWELTNLRRGRRGTDWAIDAHVSGEEFALLVDGGITRLPASTTDSWGVSADYRGVTDGQDEADADVVPFTNTGEGKRPFSPVNVEGTWDGSNNLTITWDGRSRMLAGGLGIDDQNNYEVEIITGLGRTITATGVETATYSAANQTSDGIVPGATIVGRVRQLSDVNNGRWRDFTFVGPITHRADTTAYRADSTLITADIG